MKEYRNIANILSQNGCAWEETEQMEIADDDDWYAYIKEHSGADRILDSYNDLCVLYGNSMAVGRASHKGVKMGGGVFKESWQTRERRGSRSTWSETNGSYGGARRRNLSIEVIVDALQATADMEDEIFLEACKLLENEENAKIFAAMEVNQRSKWLFKKLYR
ncbi:hypothetical protein Peur_049392 [Populus x canadensis]